MGDGYADLRLRFMHGLHLIDRGLFETLASDSAEKVGRDRTAIVLFAQGAAMRRYIVWAEGDGQSVAAVRLTGRLPIHLTFPFAALID